VLLVLVALKLAAAAVVTARDEQRLLARPRPSWP
jgi:hypothetical protein